MDIDYGSIIVIVAPPVLPLLALASSVLRAGRGRVRTDAPARRGAANRRPSKDVRWWVGSSTMPLHAVPFHDIPDGRTWVAYLALSAATAARRLHRASVVGPGRHSKGVA